MSRILISLVIEQTEPNVLFIREQEDMDKYYFISTDLMELRGKTQRNV